MSQKVPQIKPQDVVVLAKLLATENDRNVRLSDLAHELGISASEISVGLRRLRDARLVATDQRSPLRNNALEFLVHGIKYAFPGKLSAVTRGVPTAHAASPLSLRIKFSDNDIYVWPSEEGSSRGQSIFPLHPGVPKAALRDAKLYELLALIDAIRVGRSREQEMAKSELEQRILVPVEA